MEFFRSCLKFSRFSLVVVVDKQRTETLVRSVAENFGGMVRIPLLAVFDRPATAALKSDPKTGEVLEWNLVIAAATLRIGLGVDLCWTARPNQKGAGAGLVEWVKGSFFKVRQFHDRADLDAQLLDWLVEINERPSLPGHPLRAGRNAGRGEPAVAIPAHAPDRAGSALAGQRGPDRHGRARH